MSVIVDLLALQDHDEVIKELERPVKDIPVRCMQELKKVEAEREDLSKAENEVKRLKLESMNDEVEISEIKETIQKFKIQSASLKTNTECAAMNAQIVRATENLKAAESKKIDDELGTEKAQSYKNECQARFDEVKRESDEYISELNGRLAEYQARLDEAMVARVEKVKPLDIPATKRFLMYYERLRKNRWPVLIRLSENVCTGCHMSLPPSKQQEAIKNAKLAEDPARMTIVACDFCGRIVY